MPSVRRRCYIRMKALKCKTLGAEMKMANGSIMVTIFVPGKGGGRIDICILTTFKCFT